MDALNEIKRKREARRALQAQEKRRVEKELREHGDDAGYKFRRLIQQYRDALPPCQQQQQQLQQLPPLSLSSSIRPPPTPTTLLDASDAPRLSVFIRKRPLAKKELKAKGYDIISCLFTLEGQNVKIDNTSALLRRELVCHEPKLRVDCSETLENHQFRFDGVFDELQENSKVYDATVGPMVPYLVSEAATSSDTTSLTVFAYGQTGSGKTYTMKSIYRQAAVDLFQQLDELKESSSRRNSHVSVGVSFYEIYMNSVNDLLNGRSRVQLMEDGDGAVQLPGLKELPATSADELLELVHLGEQARATSANAVHDDSSRSHALLRVTLYAADNNNGSALARLSMVDLAGSERASDTQSDKKSTRMEGAEINKSLLALKECIRALDRGAAHIPFRQSKLTQLLRDSFLSQNSKTIMIATVSPCSESCNHTLNTLRYADRLKEIGAATRF
ncbi:sporangia-induced kinesin-like protein [Phytophthora cinnamomi]|uniref:sporangia-induced kinesin-like protein n=1 Tax=Phytophthora cinnamomi TaxID=4785 RepID=UPI00355992C5|nr:sporangia-induced kinesin-like protein [Phytophthora cinnamomi]